MYEKVGANMTITNSVQPINWFILSNRLPVRKHPAKAYHASYTGMDKLKGRTIHPDVIHRLSKKLEEDTLRSLPIQNSN